ncbi:DUF2949 domain-containing protein [Gloeobacter morelensis MG652769]|uniref:DUF2949 domain-containing protein n=2 Tax=Gloeobacter TaxID=33071 RepID=A0ABY3PTH7_9CYAN|nr:DUF2949 domain-containing protein [Gloeobacter morelensis MG652769]
MPEAIQMTHQPAVEHYLLHNRLITGAQLERARRLAFLWQGDLPIVLWKIGLIDLATLASLIDL